MCKLDLHFSSEEVEVKMLSHADTGKCVTDITGIL